jgi:hypothetical protein
MWRKWFLGQIGLVPTLVFGLMPDLWPFWVPWLTATESIVGYLYLLSRIPKRPRQTDIGSTNIEELEQDHEGPVRDYYLWITLGKKQQNIDLIIMAAGFLVLFAAILPIIEPIAYPMYPINFQLPIFVVLTLTIIGLILLVASLLLIVFQTKAFKNIGL